MDYDDLTEVLPKGRKRAKMPTAMLRIRIEDNVDLDAAHAAAGETGVDLQVAGPATTGGLGEQIEPITAVLIGAGVLTAAKFILDWWDKRRGGLVIDLRDSATDQIYRDRDAPWGYVIVFSADGGNVKVETKDQPKDSVERWVSGVISGAFDSATAITKAAVEAVGEDRVEDSSDEST